MRPEAENGLRQTILVPGTNQITPDEGSYRLRNIKIANGQHIITVQPTRARANSASPGEVSLPPKFANRPLT